MRLWKKRLNKYIKMPKKLVTLASADPVTGRYTMPSFDIVSEIDLVEVKNATDNATRELSTRFDFRNVNATFTFDDGTVTLTTESDFQINQMMDILRSNCVRRNVDGCRAMEIKDNDHTGKTHKRRVVFKQGIEQPIAKKIIKLIKENKLKFKPVSKVSK